MAALLASGSPIAIVAQAPIDSGITDAKVVETVGSVAINRYSFLAARAALDTTSNPMSIRLPTDSRAELWQRFKEHITQMMRLRPQTDADDRMGQLYIESVQVSGDTLSALISAGGARNCRPGWYEDRQTARVTWVRKAQKYWILVSDKTISWSESFGQCPQGRPR